MKITIMFWEKNQNLTPNYDKKHIVVFTGNNAADCMCQVRDFKFNHDCVKYTSADIINVED